MKCIHCGSDSKLKDRQANNGRCSQCKHRFAFEPTTDPRKVSDGLFERCIKDVSGEGTLFFTEKQLWYELNRRLLRKIPYIPKPFTIGAGVCGAGIAAGFLTGTVFLIPVGFIAGAAALIVGARVGKKNPKPRRVLVPLDDFRNRYLTTYQSAHGRLEKLLPEIPLSRKSSSSPSTEKIPSDLTSYSFDRALITQNADMASMLVANRFHFENNCAILAADGRYPANRAYDMILQMLKQNPALTVFALHDASAEGLRLSLNLREANWFPDRRVRLVDLGLRPLHVLKGGFLLKPETPSPVPPEIASRLTPEELTWLKQGDIVELSALRPARLMRAIYQGFNQVNAMPSGGIDDGGVVIIGGNNYGSDVWVGDGNGADVFATDSFG
jgi:DNA-directed RNA polymerase subunit RPC12/RpoP